MGDLESENDPTIVDIKELPKKIEEINTKPVSQKPTQTSQTSQTTSQTSQTSQTTSQTSQTNQPNQPSRPKNPIQTPVDPSQAAISTVEKPLEESNHVEG